MEPSVRSIMNDKRILLLQKIAGSLDWPDMEIFDSLINGFSIVGDQKPCGIFDPDLQESLPASLREGSCLQVDDDLKTLWEATLEEAGNKSWMRGPLSVEDVHDLYPSDWLPVRRFGVWQSSGDKMKLRAIDDYSENRVNSAYSYMDRITLRTLDQVVWCCAAIVRMPRVRGEVCLELASGEVLRGPLHSSLRDADNSKPLVSVLDLSSAYKQLTLHPDSRKYSIVTLKNPGTGCLL